MIVLRYVESDWAIKQRVCWLMFLAKSTTGEESDHQLITALPTELLITSNLVLAATKDRGSGNDVAMWSISVVYNHMMDMGCFSNTLDHVGGEK